MRVVEVLRRVALVLLVAVPVLVILLAWLLRGLDAREDNPLVAGIEGAADALTPAVLTDVLHDQAEWQTILLTLVAYGLLALVVVAVFAAVARVVGAAGTWWRRRRGDPEDA